MSPGNSPHKGQWRQALRFSLICAWTNGWVNNRYADALRRHRAHYDVIVICSTDEASTERSTTIDFILLCFCGCIMLYFSCCMSRIDLLKYLTHWGRVTHICVGELTVIGSDNGLSPEWRQAIIWTNSGIMLIGPLGTNFSEILIEIQTFSLKKIRLKMSSAKCCSFRLGLNMFQLPAK